MKVQVLLAILPFFSTSLATPAQSWDDICEVSPPVEETVVNGQRFRYVCRHQHMGSATAEPGTFDHPDQCAALIVTEPGTVISWRSNGRCYKATQPGTRENTAIRILAMEKVEDDGMITPDPDEELADCRAEQDRLQREVDRLQRELDQCQDDNTGTDPPINPPTTPTCGGTHSQGGSNWRVTCNAVRPGTMIRPVRTTSTLEACIDLCVAARAQGCRIAAKLEQASNNCILYSGSATRENTKPGAKTAEIQ